MRDRNNAPEPTTVVVEDLSVRYRPDTPWVLNDANLTLEPGQVTVLLGASGFGKTTLLRAIAGLLRPGGAAHSPRGWIQRLLSEADSTAEMRGRILFDDWQVTHVRPQERNVAMVSQTWDLLPHLTARQMLLLTLRLSGQKRQVAHGMVEVVLRELELTDKADRRPGELSGGEVQRLALGKLLVRQSARAYLFDECLGALDPTLRNEMLVLVRNALRKRRVTTLWITHLADEARTIADRLAVMGNGTLLQVGTYRELETNPSSLHVFKILSGQTDKHLGRIDVKGGLASFAGRRLSAQVHTRNDGPARLAIRQNGWRLNSAGDHCGLVVDCIPKDEDSYEITVKIEDDFLATAVHKQAHLPGTNVRLSLDETRILLFSAKDGQRIPLSPVLNKQDAFS